MFDGVGLGRALVEVPAVGVGDLVVGAVLLELVAAAPARPWTARAGPRGRGAWSGSAGTPSRRARRPRASPWTARRRGGWRFSRRTAGRPTPSRRSSARRSPPSACRPCSWSPRASRPPRASSVAAVPDPPQRVIGAADGGGPSGPGVGAGTLLALLLDGLSALARTTRSPGPQSLVGPRGGGGPGRRAVRPLPRAGPLTGHHQRSGPALARRRWPALPGRPRSHS